MQGEAERYRAMSRASIDPGRGSSNRLGRPVGASPPSSASGENASTGMSEVRGAILLAWCTVCVEFVCISKDLPANLAYRIIKRLVQPRSDGKLNVSVDGEGF